MKAYVAVQRKLFCLMYTLWKKEEDFDVKKANKNFVEEPQALLPEMVLG
jgi:transposase